MPVRVARARCRALSRARKETLAHNITQECGKLWRGVCWWYSANHSPASLATCCHRCVFSLRRVTSKSLPQRLQPAPSKPRAAVVKLLYVATIHQLYPTAEPQQHCSLDGSSQCNRLLGIHLRPAQHRHHTSTASSSSDSKTISCRAEARYKTEAPVVAAARLCTLVRVCVPRRRAATAHSTAQHGYEGRSNLQACDKPSTLTWVATQSAPASPAV